MNNKNPKEKNGISSLNYSIISEAFALIIPIIILYIYSYVYLLFWGEPIVLSLTFSLFFFIFGPVLVIISIKKYYSVYQKVLLSWKDLENPELKRILFIKKYKKILIFIILNLVLSFYVFIFFFISFFLNILYIILLFYWKRKIDVILRYSSKFNSEFPHFKSQIQEIEDLINQNEFNKAINLISEIKSQAKLLHLKTFSDKKNIIDFDQLEKNIIHSQEQFAERQKIHTSLLMFSKKYPRITLKELVDNVKISQNKVERITKQFIKDNLIPAKYDEDSKAIEFTFLEGEIDDLMKRYEEWELTEEGKKI
ncbi:MAG: PCI domain-containing protein [Promethearchaeota archaeon]